jgi:hypothetical protein
MHPYFILLYPVLISRYPVEANKEWIAAKEKEITEWQFHEQNRLIGIDHSLGWEW